MSNSDTPKQLPEILDSHVIAESRLLKIESLHLKFSNGVERHYERMLGSGRGAVMMIPVSDSGEVLLVKEYAAGTHNYQLGFPKGLIDAGETPEHAANRELQEEVGVAAKQLFELKSLSMAPAFFNSKMAVFVAKGLYASVLPGDEPEPLEVIRWPVDTLDELLLRDDFCEARCVAALFMAKAWLKENMNG